MRIGKRLIALSLVLALSSCATENSQPVASDWAADETPLHWWMSVVYAGESRTVVGGEPAKGVMLHDDGDGQLEPVALGHDVGLLNWVHAFPDGSMVTVGVEGALLYSEDGTTWDYQPLNTDQRLWGVWGASKDDVWVVGGRGQLDGDAVIFRGPIGDLEPVDINVQKEDVNAWYKVWGSGPDDVFIVGQRGALLRWNGTALEEQDAGLSDDLIGIWGTGPDRVATVGGRNNGVVALWDGAQWRGLDMEPVSGLNGVWMRGDVLHVVGTDEAKVLRMSFTTGELLEEEMFLGLDIPEAKGIELHAINGSPSGRVTAVGGKYYQQSAPFEGVVVSRTLGGDE